MKYYKNNNKVFAFENDGSQDPLITDEMMVMTQEEITQHLSPTPLVDSVYPSETLMTDKITGQNFKIVLENNEMYIQEVTNE